MGRGESRGSWPNSEINNCKNPLLPIGLEELREWMVLKEPRSHGQALDKSSGEGPLYQPSGQGEACLGSLDNQERVFLLRDGITERETTAGNTVQTETDMRKTLTSPSSIAPISHHCPLPLIQIYQKPVIKKTWRIKPQSRAESVGNGSAQGGKWSWVILCHFYSLINDKCGVPSASLIHFSSLPPASQGQNCRHPCSMEMILQSVHTWISYAILKNFGLLIVPVWKDYIARKVMF